MKFRSVRMLFPLSLLLFGCAREIPSALAAMSSTAFFYGQPVPVKELSAYKQVVVEAENFPDPASLNSEETTAFAYVSVGEAEGWRTSTKELDPNIFFGKNEAWGSRVADLTNAKWRDYLIEQRMKPLWERGYRGFFLDTLDSYQLGDKKSPEDQAKQEEALADIIQAMHDSFPGVKLLLNRGFAVLPKVANIVTGVVAESLFQGWNATTQSYVEVSKNDRDWLLGKLREANDQYHLPVTVIDYVDPQKKELAKKTAKRIQELGFIPWVATPGLDIVGVGMVE